MGADYLELDVHLTKDKKVVISHDHNLKRTTGVDVMIGDLNFDELPSFQNKIEISFAKDAVYNKRPDDADKIPLLEELLIK